MLTVFSSSASISNTRQGIILNDFVFTTHSQGNRERKGKEDCYSETARHIHFTQHFTHVSNLHLNTDGMTISCIMLVETY